MIFVIFSGFRSKPNAHQRFESPTLLQLCPLINGYSFYHLCNHISQHNWSGSTIVLLIFIRLFLTVQNLRSDYINVQNDPDLHWFPVRYKPYPTTLMTKNLWLGKETIKITSLLTNKYTWIFLFQWFLIGWDLTQNLLYIHLFHNYSKYKWKHFFNNCSLIFILWKNLGIWITHNIWKI